MDSSRLTNVGITILPTDVVIDESFERGSCDGHGSGSSSTSPPNNSSNTGTSSSTSGFYDVLLGNFSNHLKKQFEQRGQTPDGTILQITEQSMYVAATQLVSIIIEQRKGRFLLKQQQQQGNQHKQRSIGPSVNIRVMSKDEAVRKVAVDLFSIIKKDSNSVAGIENSLFSSAQPIGRYSQSLPAKQNQASQQSTQPMYTAANSAVATGKVVYSTNNNNFGNASIIDKETSEPPSAAELVGDGFCDIIAPQTAPSVSTLPPTKNDIIARAMHQPTSQSISSYQLSSSHAATQQQQLLQQQQQQQQQIIQQNQLQNQLQQQQYQSFGGISSGVSSLQQQHTLSSHNQHFRSNEKTLLELQLQQKYCRSQQRTQQFDNQNPNILDMNHLYQQSQPYHSKVHPNHHVQQQQQQQQNVQNQRTGIPFTDTFLSRESNQHSRPDFSLIQSGSKSIEYSNMNFVGGSNLVPHRDETNLNPLYSNRLEVESAKKSGRTKKSKPSTSASSSIQSIDHDKILNEEEQNELKKKIRRERDKARRDRLALMKREVIPFGISPVNDKKVPATIDGKKSTRKLNLSYAVRLVLAVLRRSAAGNSPVVSAKALDHPLVASRVKGNNVKEVVSIQPSLETENNATTDIPNEASKQQQQEVSIVRVLESEKERNMRLLLRHRFLAAARNNVSLFDFSKKLLEMWNCLDAIRLAGSIQTKSASKLNKKRQKHDQSVNSKRRKMDVNQSSPATSSPTSNNIHYIDGTQNVDSRLSCSFTNEVTDTQDECDNQTSNAVEGIWTYEERFAFLKEWERSGLTNWDTMAEVLFTRNRTQVSGFGRYILRKFNIARSDPPNDAIRELLLKPNAASCAVLTTEQKTALLTGQRNVVGPQENSILISPLVTTKTSNISMTATNSDNATRITSSEVGSPQTWQLDHLYSDTTTSELMAQLPPDDSIGTQLNAADLSHDEFALVDFGNGLTDNHYPTP